MKNYILALVLIFFSCKESNNLLQEKRNDLNDTIIENTKSNINEIEDNNHEDNTTKFIFSTHEDSILQDLECVFISEKVVEFKLKSKKSNEVFKGTAILKESFDGETISDKEGNGYFVQEFESNLNDCEVVLRIDTENFEVAKVLIRDCKNNINSFSNIITSDIMWGKKIK